MQRECRCMPYVRMFQKTFGGHEVQTCKLSLPPGHTHTHRRRQMHNACVVCVRMFWGGEG